MITINYDLYMDVAKKIPEILTKYSSRPKNQLMSSRILANFYGDVPRALLCGVLHLNPIHINQLSYLYYLPNLLLAIIIDFLYKERYNEAGYSLLLYILIKPQDPHLVFLVEYFLANPQDAMEYKEAASILERMIF